KGYRLAEVRQSDRCFRVSEGMSPRIVNVDPPAWADIDRCSASLIGKPLHSICKGPRPSIGDGCGYRGSKRWRGKEGAAIDCAIRRDPLAASSDITSLVQIHPRRVIRIDQLPIRSAVYGEGYPVFGCPVGEQIRKDRISKDVIRHQEQIVSVDQ